jgi:pimeloyl-ACP methyl ester carboxylesterase
VQEFSRGDLVFDVTDSGPTDGEVVVLLHGFPEDRQSWRHLTPSLVDAGFRVLAPDQRGYSPRARPTRRRDYAMRELMADVLALLDAAGADKAHVVGHDWGGAVAWSLGEHHPDRLKTVASLTTPHPAAMQRAMVTSNQGLRSSYFLFFQIPWLPELLLRRGGGRRTIEQLVSSGLSRDNAERYVTRLRDTAAARAELNWYRGVPFSMRDNARGKVRVPTLYVYATGDRFLGRKAADLTGGYVDAPYTYEVLDGASHWLPEEYADDIAPLLRTHLRAHM